MALIGLFLFTKYPELTLSTEAFLFFKEIDRAYPFPVTKESRYSRELLAARRNSFSLLAFLSLSFSESISPCKVFIFNFCLILLRFAEALFRILSTNFLRSSLERSVKSPNYWTFL